MSGSATLIPLDNVDPALVEALLDRAFEPERHKRTAYKVREGTDWLPGLSFAAIDGEEHLVGTIQCWPVALTDPQGRAHPMIMVGPVAVLPEHQGQGYGKACLQALPDAARRAWPQIKGLELSVDTDNQAALTLYRQQGWVDSGDAYRGRIGYERRMALAF